MVFFFIPSLLFIFLNDEFNKVFIATIDRLNTLSPSRIFLDYSLQDKIKESWVLLNEIIKNPIVGFGLGATFSFFTPLRGFLINTWYAHNFYLFIWFKLGLLGLISFLSLFYNSFKKGIYLLSISEADIYKHLILGLLASFIGIVISSIALPDLFSRGGVLGMVFIISIITLLEKKYSIDS
tara:strand:- start:52 stop:594 length:543 start_codon:yes stop_codon:yes gene_type:complete